MKTLKIVVLLILLGATTQINAQTERSEKRAEKMEKLEAQRAAFILEQLNLSPQEADQFLPIYQDFRSSEKDLRKEGREGKRDIDFAELTDDQAREMIQLRLQKEEQILALKKLYSADLQTVISPVKVLELARAERAFKRKVLDRVKKRKREKHKGKKYKGE